MLKLIKVILVLFALVTANIGIVQATPAASVSSPFLYDFRVNGVLNEVGNMDDSSSPYFWLNSGARFLLENGIGKTLQYELTPNHYWRLTYLAANPLDTDNGFHPQNILRLITRSRWQNFREELWFNIKRDQLSASPNREGHNALLLFSRYSDGQNLYYAGIRVDGKAVIKKKINGQYHTLAIRQIFPGTYDRLTNPNLIPKNTWIGLRLETKNNQDGSVSLKLFMDNGRTGIWTNLLTTTDNGVGGNALVNSAFAGIRTDFMDVEFDNYKFMNI